MGNQNHTPSKERRGSTKDVFAIAEKSVMGGYFNIARLNFFKTIVTIFVQAEIKKLKTFLVIKNLDKLPAVEKQSNKDMVVFTIEEERQTPDGNIKMVKVEKAALRLISNTNFAKLPFVRHQRERFKQRDADYYKSLAARYLTVDGKPATIQLSDGLFTPFILKVLKDKYKEKEELQLHLQNDDTNGNAAYLISSFFESVLNDSSQPYYRTFTMKSGNQAPSDFAHIYDLFNILNNVKEANAYKPVPMTTDDINSRLTKRAVEKDGHFVIRQNENEEDYIVKQITIDIEEHLQWMKEDVERRIKKNHLKGYRAEKARKNGEEEIEKMLRRLTRLIGDVKRNERTIRRYKTQDMVLFLMAKKIFGTILAQQNGQADNLFRLKNVCDDNFLSQTVKFEFPVSVGDFTIKVVQENMALKNYGEFYRFLNDDRLQSLLKQLKGITEVSHADLTGELANYDQRRSQIFHIMQQLEKIAYENNQDALNDSQSPLFYKDNDKDNLPKRNNFRSLLALFENIEGNKLTSADCERLIEIRNAFCHNTYRMDISDMRKSLPTIAIQILNSIERMLKDAGVS